MMDNDVPTDFIPQFDNLISGYWAPILLYPIGGAYDRLLVGVATATSESFHVEMANAISRLKCFYGQRAEGVIFSIELTKSLLLQDLAERGVEALLNPKRFLSGVRVGKARQAEGLSLLSIAESWLSALSSLQDQKGALSKTDGLDSQEMSIARSVPRRHQLPQLVYERVLMRNPQISHFFSERIIHGTRDRSLSSLKVEVDYKGPRLAANLATLNVSKVMNEVGKIKQSLYDLSVDRSRDAASGMPREHELIVEVPVEHEADLSVTQKQRLREVCRVIEGQADELSLRFRRFGTPEQIVDHIISREAA